MNEQQSLLQFPCRFPIKVMGRSGNEFEFAVVQIMRKHIPNLAEGAIHRRDSKQNNYAALTVVVEARP